MNNITYRQFLALVDAAAGPFSYRFAGMRFTCDPAMYAILHGRDHIDAARRAQ